MTKLYAQYEPRNKGERGPNLIRISGPRDILTWDFIHQYLSMGCHSFDPSPDNKEAGAYITYIAEDKADARKIAEKIERKLREVIGDLEIKFKEDFSIQRKI